MNLAATLAEIVSALRTKAALLVLLLLSGPGFYVLYVIKVKLGIDLFRHGGLHLPMPRALLRRLLQLFTSL